MLSADQRLLRGRKFLREQPEQSGEITQFGDLMYVMRRFSKARDCRDPAA